MRARWKTPLERVLGFAFFAVLLLVAAKACYVTYLCASLLSLVMPLVPCKQRFIRQSYTLWKLRQLYFLALGVLFLLSALKGN